jgi:Family of unknown function (DUF6152)
MAKTISSLMLALVLVVAAVPAYAHHSFTAEFTDDHMIVVKGKLLSIDWINPHIFYHVEATDEKGNVTEWLFQSFTPSWYRKAGITRAMLGEGQIVTIEAYPAKDGTKTYGFFRKITFADGHEYMLH